MMIIIRRIVIAFALVAMAQGLAFGQAKSERKGWVYGFAGVGGRSNDSDPVVTAGVGGEGYFGSGVGIGGEISYLSSTRNAGSGIALASFNTSYHFNRSGKLVPFITGGGSVAFNGGGGAGGGNFGGGLNYWMSNHVGLRFEVRDYIFSSDSPNTVLFRVGVSFK